MKHKKNTKKKYKNINWEKKHIQKLQLNSRIIHITNFLCVIKSENFKIKKKL